MTVCVCFAAFRRQRRVRRSVPKSVLQSLVSLLVLTRLDYGNGSLVGIPLYQLERLQSVINSSARLMFSLSRYDHITPALPPVALAQSTGADRIQARPSRLQVSSGCSAVVPRRRPLPDGRSGGSASSTFGLVTISGCAPSYAAVDVRRPSFSGPVAASRVWNTSCLNSHCLFYAVV